MTPLLKDYFSKTTSLTDMFKKFNDYYTIIGQNLDAPSKDDLFTKLVKNLKLDEEILVNYVGFVRTENHILFSKALKEDYNLSESYMSSKESFLKTLDSINKLREFKPALLLSQCIHLFSSVYDGNNMSKDQEEDFLKQLCNSNHPQALILVAGFYGIGFSNIEKRDDVHRQLEGLGYALEALVDKGGGGGEQIINYLNNPQRGKDLTIEEVLDKSNSHAGLRALKTHADQGGQHAQLCLAGLYTNKRFVFCKDPYFTGEAVKLYLNLSKKGILAGQEHLVNLLCSRITLPLETYPSYIIEAVQFLLPLTVKGTICEKNRPDLAKAFRKRFSPKS